ELLVLDKLTDRGTTVVGHLPVLCGAADHPRARGGSLDLGLFELRECEERDPARHHGDDRHDDKHFHEGGASLSCPESTHRLLERTKALRGRSRLGAWIVLLHGSTSLFTNADLFDAVQSARFSIRAIAHQLVVVTGA